MGWALHQETREFTLGITLGLLGGLVNFRYLAVKIRQVTQSIANPEKKAFSIGFVTRICLAALITMFSVKIGHLSLVATVSGLFIPQLLSIPVGIYLSLKSKL